MLRTRYARLSIFPLLLLVGVAVVLAVSSVFGAENGSVPEWIEAIGTSAAFLVAAVALRQELQDRHEERERRWQERARLLDINVGGSGINKQYWDVKITYSNDSVEFVYAVVFEAFTPDGERVGTDELADMGPGERAESVVRIPWLTFEDLRWTVTWRDTYGASWRRTHRGEVKKTDAATARLFRRI